MSGKTALFPRNDRPYGLKRAAFQTEIALIPAGQLERIAFHGREIVAQTAAAMNEASAAVNALSAQAHELGELIESMKRDG